MKPAGFLFGPADLSHFYVDSCDIVHSYNMLSIKQMRLCVWGRWSGELELKDENYNGFPEKTAERFSAVVSKRGPDNTAGHQSNVI